MVMTKEREETSKIIEKKDAKILMLLNRVKGMEERAEDSEEKDLNFSYVAMKGTPGSYDGSKQ